jgi:hypothetical protein
MDPSLEQARDAVQSARELTDDPTAREQLDSIDDGLGTLTGDDAPSDPGTEGERLEELEHQLRDLGDDVDDLSHQHLESARDHIDAYRREYAQDWE